MSYKRRIHHLLAPLIYRDGTALVPADVAAEWPERQFLRQLLKRLAVDCVIDVGANVGQYASELRLIGFRGTILSFEPSPAAFAKLSTASAGDDRWHVFNCALGSEPGTAWFNIMRRSEFNSFLAPSTEDTDVAEDNNAVIDRVEVEIERLDVVLPRLRAEHGFTRPFLKSDTQGFDLEVFRGGSGIHSELVGIQCELAIKRLYEQVVPWTKAIDEYVAAGFELAGLYQVNPRIPLFLECDCFFIRSAASGRQLSIQR